MMKRRILFPMALLVSISLFFAACADDNGNDVNNDPQNVKTYTGTTDQGENVKFQTGEIKGELWLLEYDLTVIYNENDYSEDFTFSEYNSQGIQKMNNGQFEIKLGDKDFVNGQVSGNQITGNYSYVFIVSPTLREDILVTGTFTATAQ